MNVLPSNHGFRLLSSLLHSNLSKFSLTSQHDPFSIRNALEIENFQHKKMSSAVVAQVSSEASTNTTTSGASTYEKKPKSQTFDNDEQLKAKGFPLETKWTFWYANTKVDKEGHPQDQQQQQDNGSHYRDCLNKLATVSTIAEFCKVYAYLQKPSKLPKNSNISLFRHEVVPMWESYV